MNSYKNIYNDLTSSNIFYLRILRSISLKSIARSSTIALLKKEILPNLLVKTLLSKKLLKKSSMSHIDQRVYIGLCSLPPINITRKCRLYFWFRFFNNRFGCLRSWSRSSVVSFHRKTNFFFVIIDVDDFGFDLLSYMEVICRIRDEEISDL